MEGKSRNIRLEGENLVIPLNSLETLLAEKAMPVISASISFYAKLTFLLVFHLLQTDKKTFGEWMSKIEAGGNPETEMAPLFAKLRQAFENNPDLLSQLDEVPEAIERLLSD